LVFITEAERFVCALRTASANQTDFRPKCFNVTSVVLKATCLLIFGLLGAIMIAQCFIEVEVTKCEISMHAGS
jgi:hypothetical protein